MGKVTQQDRAEAVEFVEGRVWLEKLQDPAMAEKAQRALAVLNAGIAAMETLAAAEKRAKEEATAASWFAEQNWIEQEKRRAAEGERDALAAIRCCLTCGEIGDADCCCEWQCGDPDDCVAPGYAHWTQAPVESILRRKREFDEQQTESTAAQVPAEHLAGAPEGAEGSG